MDNNSKKTINNIISETLLISIIPILAYASAITYEVGYNTYFNIPLELITISSNTIYKVLGYITVVIIIIFYVYQLFYFIIENFIILPKPIYDIFVKTSIWYALLFLSILTFGFKLWEHYIYAIIMAASQPLVYLLSPLFLSKRSNNSYTERLQAMIEIEQDVSNRNDSLFEKILKSSGVKVANVMFLLLGVFVFIYSAYGYGKRTASEEEYFYVNKANPSNIYLRFYSDKVIGADYSAKDKTIGALIIEKLPPDTAMLISLQKIGPLKKVNID